MHGFPWPLAFAIEAIVFVLENWIYLLAGAVGLVLILLNRKRKRR